MRIDSFRAMTSRRLRTIEAAATVRAAAAILSGSDVGLVVVCDDRGAAAGLISKSDLVRHLARLGSPQTSAATLMTRPFMSCRLDDELHLVWQSMTKRRLQNVPVLDTDSRPLGVLDVRDAMRVLLEEERLEEESLASYIAGVGYR